MTRRTYAVLCLSERVPSWVKAAASMRGDLYSSADLRLFCSSSTNPRKPVESR